MDNNVEGKLYNDFTALRCWQNCRDVKLFFYMKVLPKLPACEKNNLNIQIRKSARSITANIAEGSGRFHYQEAIQYLRISRGSLDELYDDLIFCFDMKFITEGLYEDGKMKIQNAKASLNGFIHYYEKQKLMTNKSRSKS